ncbi:MAG TPA: bifunctional DNA-formamidopyrimidine glycosylase/DNA-(apurinic or apyrimidinic site) lyase [Candidatus Baltobacteraceae bacterium]|nr:bifunctional DNA-formamidopyrimidine glycosylase/DNA-(apurinic or apyrimidinic site) lyase [Candidatus Baltobacteraceae bacterium]
MPELPEVETIVRGLRRAVTGKTIASVEIRLAKMAQAPAGVDFQKALKGERIVSLGRRGKYAVIELSSGRSLVVSLRMTGRLVVQPKGAPPYPYGYIILAFTDGDSLVFADVRTFGRMRLIEAGEPWDQALGLEPLLKSFTPERFIAMLSGRTTPVKAFLLDQRRIAGVGNIYACEALWEAGIRPGKPAGTLTKPAARRLHRALVDVLKKAVNMRGSSIDDYVDADGLKGGFQNVLSVYGKAGKKCSRCGGTVERTVIAGRGTWWCRKHQK